MWDRGIECLWELPWRGRRLLSDPKGQQELPGHLSCAGSRGGSHLAQFATRKIPFCPVLPEERQVPGTASWAEITDGWALFPWEPRRPAAR